MTAAPALPRPLPSPPPAGDFEGGIKLWDLEAGACIASWEYGGAQWERAVGKLAFLPGPAPEAASGSADGSGALGGARSCGGSRESDGVHCKEASSMLLACGQDGMMKLWEVRVRDAPPCTQQQSGGQQDTCRPTNQPQRQLKQGASQAASAAGARAASAASAGRAAAGLKAGGGGSNSSGEHQAAATPLNCSVRLVGEVRGAQRQRDCVTAVTLADAPGSSGGTTTSGSTGSTAGNSVLLLSGDSSGYVRVWSVADASLDCLAEAAPPARLTQASGC